MLEAWLVKRGYSTETLGKPLTESQLARNRELARKLQPGIFFVLSTSLGALWGLKALVQSPIVTQLFAPEYIFCSHVFAIVLMAFVVSRVTDKPLFIYASDAIASGFYCERLLALAEEYPETRAHLAAINAQHRPVYVSDAMIISRAEESLRHEREQERRRTACQKLHSIQ